MRTGRASSGSSVMDQKTEQQRRIAARAAQAMAQVIQRRRKSRLLFVWGDRRKVTIQRYPDGTQEILIPQNLTAEQEHYEFPPRSRFLKKLAVSTAERRRYSTQPPSSSDPHVSATPTAMHSTVAPPVPDQVAMAEWFSSHKLREDQQRQKKDQAVIDWMTDVERSTPLKPEPSPCLSSQPSEPNPPTITVPPLPKSASLSPSLHSPLADLHFESEIGRRSILNSQRPVSCLLVPPLDNSPAIHYVPRSLLHRNKRAKNTFTTQDSTADNHTLEQQVANHIQDMWRQDVKHTKVSDRPPPISGMVQLVDMFHTTLKHQQQKAQERMQKLEILLNEERKRREKAEKEHQLVVKRFETLCKTIERHDTYEHLMHRVMTLEESIVNESSRRQDLTGSVKKAVEMMNLLQRSVEKQAHESQKSQKTLQQQLDQTLAEIQHLKKGQRPSSQEGLPKQAIPSHQRRLTNPTVTVPPRPSMMRKTTPKTTTNVTSTTTVKTTTRQTTSKRPTKRPVFKG
ncbi:uncharacterized protein BYT42DRAFT_613421 [Radiomyces spectabilis]|uniref:uncharacterized protein n=1 Tax=Radiomyces spectabilis TaxID=64574 RepID=UPI0022205796|nr:uncharacterized protein BYT42DRAFT_613421 [Radiomyces spectabilis]KAI8379082.1 hypothetical protein BYT42DRAFT_613421 [Radiomyces spectabilis]